MTTATGIRRVATYERVSSDDQRERQTIQTQTEALERRLSVEDRVEIVARYSDDGVSGMQALAERPGGGQLLRDAAARRFDELWVYRTDRLGRNLADMAATGRRLEQLGMGIFSVVEGRMEPFVFDLMAVLAQNEHRTFRRRSADGVARAAREGRYVGGIVPLGYRVVGAKHTARLEPDRAPLWGDRSAVELVRQIYRWLALEGWSCVRVARELTLLGVPTHYVRDGRLVKAKTGERRQRTQGIWRAGRIRNLVVNQVYKGVLQFGRRTTPETAGREVISGAVEPLVSQELWQAAQDALARNRCIPKNSPRINLLRGTIHCALDGLSFVSSHGRDGIAYYRCGGKTRDRGPLGGKCPSKLLRADWLESLVWADIEAWLRDPGSILDELEAEREGDAGGAVAEAESITLAGALESANLKRQVAIDLCVSGMITKSELQQRLFRIDAERVELQRRLDSLEPVPEGEPEISPALLDQLRERLDGGLTQEQRQEIASLLVSIVIETGVTADGEPTPRVRISFRFPDVVSTRTGSGSWPRRAFARASPRGRG